MKIKSMIRSHLGPGSNQAPSSDASWIKSVKNDIERDLTLKNDDPAVFLLLIKLFIIGSRPSDNSTSEAPYAEHMRTASLKDASEDDDVHDVGNEDEDDV